MKVVRIAVSLGLVAAVLALVGPAGASPTYSNPAITVSVTSAQAEDYALGANGTAAIAYQDASVPNNEVLLAVRRPGTAWPLGTAISDSSVNAMAPAVTVAGTGQVDTAWRTADGVFVRRVRPDGTTDAAVRVSDVTNTNTPNNVDIASNAGGTVAVVWTQFSAGPDRVWAAIRPAGGTWGAPKQVSPDPSGPSDYSYLSTVSVTPTGDVVVAWTQGTSVPPEPPHLARLTAGTSTFTSTPLTGGATFDLALATDSAGNALLSWVTNSSPEVWAAYWAPPDSAAGLPTDLGAGTAAVPGFIGIGAAAVAVLTGTNPTSTLTIWKRATDGSLNWDGSTQPAVSQDMTSPAVAFNEHGRLTVALRNSSTGQLETAGVNGASNMALTLIPGGAGGAAPGVAMTPAGDTMFGWLGITPSSGGEQRVGVTLYDVSGPVTAENALPVWTLTPTTSLHWTARDTWATNATSTISRRSAAATGGFGGSVVVGSTSATSRAVGVAVGTTACFAVRATDPSGNTGPASAARCTAAPVDDRALVRGAGWAKILGTAFYAHTAVVARQAGAVLTKSVVARRLALVASTCGTCGAVRVYLNGHLLKTIRLHGLAHNKVVIPIITYTSARSVRVKIVTTSAAKVVIDGLGVSAS